jgi:hypothetical protein
MLLTGSPSASRVASCAPSGVRAWRPLFRSTLPPSPSPAVPRRHHLTQAEAAEHPEALFFLGHECLQGKDSGTTGTTQGVSRALEYFLRAAAKGHGDALCSAGAMYYNGLGVPQVMMLSTCPYWGAGGMSVGCRWDVGGMSVGCWWGVAKA